MGLLSNSLAAISPTVSPAKQHAIPTSHSVDRGLPAAGVLIADVVGVKFSVSSISITASPMSRSRRCGSFSKQRRSRERMFVGVLSGSDCQLGSVCRTLASVSEIVSPLKGIVAVNISYSTQPNDQMSLRLSVALPRACSGLM